MKDIPHRREFVRTVALGASAAAIGHPPALLGEEPAARGTARPAPAPAPAPARATSEVDARMEVVLARFGSQLDADARDTVRAEVEAIVRRAEALRKFPLTNGDGPFPIFIPYRDGKDHG